MNLKCQVVTDTGDLTTVAIVAIAVLIALSLLAVIVVAMDTVGDSLMEVAPRL